MRLIDADFVVKGLVEIRDNLPEGFPKRFQQETIRKALRCIEESPTIEAEPVRHGRWILGYVEPGYCTPGGNRPWVCSECGQVESWSLDKPKYKYCHCGARMDGE